MSDDAELIRDLKNIIEGAHDDVSVEEMGKSLRNIGIVLVTFRGFMVEAGFSGEWAERACTSLWNGFFPNSPMEVK